MSAERLKRMVHWLPSMSEAEIEHLFEAVYAWRNVLIEEKAERERRRDSGQQWRDMLDEDKL